MSEHSTSELRPAPRLWEKIQYFIIIAGNREMIYSRLKEQLLEMEMLRMRCTALTADIDCLTDELDKSREEVCVFCMQTIS